MQGEPVWAAGAETPANKQPVLSAEATGGDGEGGRQPGTQVDGNRSVLAEREPQTETGLS